MEKNIFRKSLVVGIIMLFMGAAIASGFYTNSMNNPKSIGHSWLYVGGTGEGNYTDIQDAIDNASDSDTVFVYSYSSPYYENVVINNTINLIGENKNSTVIDGYGNGDVVRVNCNCVNVSGFTIQNSGLYNRGMYLGSNKCNIHDNIIFNNGLGIDLRFSSNNNITSNNIIMNEKYGIYIYRSHRNIIKNNIIRSNNKDGIIIRGSEFNTISGNTIDSNKDIGIYITAGTLPPIWAKIPSQFNVIKSNNITLNNDGGIYLLNSRFNIIIKNNFIDNEIDILIKSPLFYRNRCMQNYWNEPMVVPKLISRIIIISGFGIPPSFIIYLPWFTIDWYPAHKPYNI